MTADRARVQRGWVAVPLVVSLLPVAGLFSTTRIFYVRDLSFFFWSRHLWLRHTFFSGRAPWWDPYVAGGQSAIADALNQLAMPVTLAIRLLPSDALSFNLWVALPLPIAALGTFVFLRRRFAREAAPEPALTDRAAAAFGACVFALSGPVVSMVNLPNFAWSVALMPWVLAACGTGWALVALAYGLQALCGEPVSWAATGCLAAALSLSQKRIKPIAGLAAGALLAAAQLVPTAMASMRAHRGALATPDFWSLHPLALWEAVAPHLFGNYYDAFLADLPWMGALNFGRDPFFYSLYVGPLILVLASAGASRRRNLLWAIAAVAFTVAALGGYTPVYPALRALVPPLMYFRFPVKYIVFVVFAVAVLAAEGWRGRTMAGWLPALAGSCGLAVTVALLARTDVLAAWAHWLAVATHLKDPAAGAGFLARVAPPLALRASGLLLAAALLVALARRRSCAWWLLGGLACADLLVTNAALNPTMEVANVAPPAWFTAAAGSQRLYIGGRVRGYMNTADPDAASTWQIPAESTAVAGRMELNANLPMAPSGWRVREALSYDLPYLWPAEYEATVRRFEQASHDERDAFLRRTGVRWCVVPADRQPYGQPPQRPIAQVPDWNMRVFDCHPHASRVAFAAGPGDAGALFDPALPDDEAAGEARIVEDLPSRVSIEATATRPALLVLRDSYDPSWRADVDGVPVPIVRANGLHRGVALSAGRHVIRFSYRPREFFAGLTISVATLLLIGFSGFRGFSRFRFSGFPSSARTGRTPNPKNPRNPQNPEYPDNPERGFTLMELMVVLAIIAILLAIAFSEYRGMQARGNEASAIASLRSIAAAQSQFALTCGNTKYAVGLPALGQPVPSTGAAFLSPDLTSGETIEKSGYVFTMKADPLNDAMPACNGAAVSEGYAVTADPVKPGISGVTYYGVNADRVLYMDDQKSFKDDLPQTGAAPHGLEVK